MAAGTGGKRRQDGVVTTPWRQYWRESPPRLVWKPDGSGGTRNGTTSSSSPSRSTNKYEQQRLAAEIRAAIAEKELDIHQTTMDQADELDHFYKNKFTSLGLYNYLATTLTRLHRDAYNTAEGLARMAQRAYAFERDDDTVFIAPGNWQADKNGLLAGEKLTLQLEQLETAYLRANTRQLEVSQSFSAGPARPRRASHLPRNRQLRVHHSRDPLRPRLPRPVQAHHQVRAHQHPVRRRPLHDGQRQAHPHRQQGPQAAHHRPRRPRRPARTAHAQHRHQHRRQRRRRLRTHLPRRALPALRGRGRDQQLAARASHQLRMFDYATISDIILHISYTARDDDAFRATVETAIIDSLTAYASTAGMHRLFSLRHDFPDAFYQLLNPAGPASRPTSGSGVSTSPTSCPRAPSTSPGPASSSSPKEQPPLTPLA